MSVPDPVIGRQRVVPEMRETRPRMAKAVLRKPELERWRYLVGAVVTRAMGLVGWNLEQLAAAVDRDPRQVRRWTDGGERPQFDALFAVERLRSPLVQALGELAGADVVTTITVRRLP